MADIKLMVMYPCPHDIRAFEKLYEDEGMPMRDGLSSEYAMSFETFEKLYHEEHVPMIVKKLVGKTRFVATKVVATPDGTPPPFYRIAEIHFPSLEALQTCAQSAGGKETLPHAGEISSGGAPSIYYDCDIPYNMNGPKHQIPGNWFCCAYQYWPDDQTLARRLYAGAKKKFMVKEPDGSAHINFPPELGGGEDLVGFGAAAACAWEFGDLDTHAQLMTWANTRYQPTAKEGEFYYQFGIDEPWPRGWPNDWLLMTVAGGQGSWYRLYNEPNLRKFHQPTVSGIDYPTVSVAQAYYDESLGALMLALLPGDAKKAGGKTTFKVTNLEGMERRVLQDGAPFKEWKATGEGEIEVTTTVDRHTFVIR